MNWLGRLAAVEKRSREKSALTELTKAPSVSCVSAYPEPREIFSALADAGDCPVDWIKFYEERVRLRRVEAGYSAEMAERLAYSETVEAWCEQHPTRHHPSRCAGCREPLDGYALDLPDGSRVHWGEAQDFACLLKHGHRRKCRAVDALFVVGLKAPAGWSVR